MCRFAARLQFGGFLKFAISLLLSAFVLSFAATASARIVSLIELRRSNVTLSESFILYSEDGREKMYLSTNSLTKSRLEFGTYQREAKGLRSEVKRINDKSRSNTDSSDATLLKGSSTTNWSGWRVYIFGSEIPTDDPRFDRAFEIFVRETKRKDWKPQSVTRLELHRPHVVVKVAQKPPRQRQVSEICKLVIDDQVVCNVEGGAVYLPK